MAGGGGLPEGGVVPWSALTENAAAFRRGSRGVFFRRFTDGFFARREAAGFFGVFRAGAFPERRADEILVLREFLAGDFLAFLGMGLDFWISY